jgi:hypothetical protein
MEKVSAMGARPVGIWPTTALLSNADARALTRSARLMACADSVTQKKPPLVRRDVRIETPAIGASLRYPRMASAEPATRRAESMILTDSAI